MFDRHVHPLCTACIQKPNGSLMCHNIVDCTVDHYQKMSSPEDIKSRHIRIPETEIIRIAELKKFENQDDILVGKKPRWKKLGEQ